MSCVRSNGLYKETVTLERERERKREVLDLMLTTLTILTTLPTTLSSTNDHLALNLLSYQRQCSGMTKHAILQYTLNCHVLVEI